MSNERPESKDEARQRAVARLSPREEYAYKIWQGTNKPLIGSTLNSQLFQLYLQDKTAEEIRQLNPQLSLGEVVAAKVEGNWDEHKDEYLQKLLDGTAGRVQQSTLETVDFLCDMLAVAKKRFGQRFQRYLQSGDEKELGDFNIENLKQLKDAIEALHKLTGQDKKIAVSVAQESPLADPVQDVDKPASAAEVGAFLRVLAGKKE